MQLFNCITFHTVDNSGADPAARSHKLTLTFDNIL